MLHVVLSVRVVLFQLRLAVERQVNGRAGRRRRRRRTRLRRHCERRGSHLRHTRRRGLRQRRRRGARRRLCYGLRRCARREGARRRCAAQGRGRKAKSAWALATACLPLVRRGVRVERRVAYRNRRQQHAREQRMAAAQRHSARQRGPKPLGPTWKNGVASCARAARSGGVRARPSPVLAALVRAGASLQTQQRCAARHRRGGCCERGRGHLRRSPRRRRALARGVVRLGRHAARSAPL